MHASEQVDERSLVSGYVGGLMSAVWVGGECASEQVNERVWMSEWVSG
jgi:hypothetical protein